MELPVINPRPTSQPALNKQEILQLQSEIKSLAKDSDTVILAHNYQLPEVQEVADFTGDSLELSRKAAEAKEQQILFCGVHFMAETASILSPDKNVLIPDLKAGCSLADSINAEQLADWKSQYPEALVVMYVNTSAEVKALTDYCCTSSNAVNIVKHIWEEEPGREILFGPDMWLGSFVSKKLKGEGIVEDLSNFHIWDGECHVHAGIRPADIIETREAHPNAEFLIHPECGCSSQAMEYVASGDIDSERVRLLSTSQMIAAVEENPDGEFIIATENGMLYPLQKAAPKAILIEANRMAFCKYMKMIDLPKMKAALENTQFVVSVPKETAVLAELPIQRMVSIG